jgi:outer membrane lipoprotein-sorting protein
MKQKIGTLGIIAIVIVIMASLVACSSGGTTTSQSSAAATTSTAKTSAAATTAASTTKTSVAATSAAVTSTAKTSTTAATSQAGGNLAGILGQVFGIASMKYDMVTTTPDNQSSTTTMYVKKNQARMESTQQGQQIVILINSDTKTMYMYMPAQNMALKQDFGQAPKSASDNSNSVLQNSPTVVGTETLDAKLCTVIQYTANGSTTKEWIWQAKGLPVRMQVTSSQGTTTTDFKNYDFSDIPDSTFVLPAGVTIQSLGALPTGLPGGLPAH